MEMSIIATRPSLHAMKVIGAISPFNADVSEPKSRHVSIFASQLGIEKLWKIMRYIHV